MSIPMDQRRVFCDANEAAVIRLRDRALQIEGNEHIYLPASSDIILQWNKLQV